MSCITAAQRRELGLVKLRRDHYALLWWLRAMTGLVRLQRDDLLSPGSRHLVLDDLAVFRRRGLLLAHAKTRLDTLMLHDGLWFPWFRWSARRYLGRQADRVTGEHDRVHDRLASLETRGLVACHRGARKILAVRLTHRGLRALEALAAERGEMLGTHVLTYPGQARAMTAEESPTASRRRLDRRRTYEELDDEARRAKKAGAMKRPTEWRKYTGEQYLWMRGLDLSPPKRRGPVTRDEVVILEQIVQGGLGPADPERAAKRLVEQLGLMLDA